MLSLYTDGASRGNPGKSAIAFLAFKNNQLIKQHTESIGRATNNVAEYKAVITALEYARNKDKEITLTSDSELVIRQITGKYKLRAKYLLPYHNRIKYLETFFQEVVYKNAPRDHPFISRCDKMVNEILDRG